MLQYFLNVFIQMFGCCISLFQKFTCRPMGGPHSLMLSTHFKLSQWDCESASSWQTSCCNGCLGLKPLGLGGLNEIGVLAHEAWQWDLQSWWSAIWYRCLRRFIPFPMRTTLLCWSSANKKKASTAALAVITFPSTNSFELECITAYPVVDNNAIKEWKILA